MAGRPKEGADGVEVYLIMISGRTVCSSGCGYLDTEIKVILRPSGHYPVEAVDGVRDAVFSGEQCIDLGLVREVHFDSDGLGTFGSLGLENVGQDQLDVGGFAIDN